MSSAAFLNNSKEKHFMCLFHIKHHYLPDNTWLFRIYFPTFALDLLCTHSAISLVFVLFLELQHVQIVANYFLGLTAISPRTSPFLHKFENRSIFIFDFSFCDRFRLDWWYKKDRGFKFHLILVGISSSDFFSPSEIPAWRLERVWDIYLDSFLSKH